MRDGNSAAEGYTMQTVYSPSPRASDSQAGENYDKRKPVPVATKLRLIEVPEIFQEENSNCMVSHYKPTFTIYSILLCLTGLSFFSLSCLEFLCLCLCLCLFLFFFFLFFSFLLLCFAFFLFFSFLFFSFLVLA